MSQKSFEMVLPEGAKITQSLAAGPGGMPVTSAPIPTGEKNHYTFLFPIRPGETRFQVAYTMPYNGSAKIEPKLLRATENFAVSVPKSIHVTPAPGSKLEAKGEDAGMSVYVATNAAAGSPVGFTVSGTGTVPLDNASEGGDAAAGAQTQNPADATNRPGGGLGTPVNTPDPLFKYRWWIIAVVVLGLVAGAAYTMSGSAHPATVAAANSGRSASASVSISMTDALKEELFQLESDRLQNKISAEDYAKAKAAMDLLMRRASSRQS
jgi:hypothetical protein